MAEGSEPLLTNTERRLVTYKAFQEVVEAITDVCAMFVADNEMGVGDDYENLDKAHGFLLPTSKAESWLGLSSASPN